MPILHRHRVAILHLIYKQNKVLHILHQIKQLTFLPPTFRMKIGKNHVDFTLA